MKALPRTYDPVFEARLSVPVEYARALSWMESGMNPKNKTGDHWGLFQAGPENLRDYNAAHGTSWTMDDLLNPDVNAQVWAFESERIRRALVGGGLVENWADREWVALFTAGWNSGYSEKAGVRRVLDWLNSKGLAEVNRLRAAKKLPPSTELLTHDNVFIFGKDAGALWTLQQQNTKGGNKYRWQRDVAAVYAAEAAAAGNADILANLEHWATKRIPYDKLRPPGSSPAVASTSAPLPDPERAQGKTSGEGGGGLLMILLLLLFASEKRR
jgi:hypothetical protein